MMRGAGAEAWSAARRALWRVKHVACATLARAGYVEHFDSALARQLRDTRATLALDVGANVGQYAGLLRRLGFRGHIASFEPMRELVPELRARFRRDRSWSVWEVAAGDEECEQLLRAGDHSEFASLLEPSEFGRRIFAAALGPRGPEARSGARPEVGAAAPSARAADDNGRARRVRVRRLEDVIPELVADPSRELMHLKLDTQGYDLRALRGVGRWLDRVVSLQTELSFVPIYERQPGAAETLAEVASLGFAVTAISPVTRERATGAVIEADCLLRRVR